MLEVTPLPELFAYTYVDGLGTYGEQIQNGYHIVCSYYVPGESNIGAFCLNLTEVNVDERHFCVELIANVAGNLNRKSLGCVTIPKSNQNNGHSVHHSDETETPEISSIPFDSQGKRIKRGGLSHT